MGEQLYDANDVKICAEVRGPDDGEPLLLVMGLGAQLVSWDDGFADSLVERGFRVIRFDNRDVGRSTWFDDRPIDLGEVMAAVGSGQTPEVPYLLSDMAADAVGLLDALDIDAAHVVGASMGGMIVQTMAIEHATRVHSVTSIMSTTGDTDVGQPTGEAMALLVGSAPTTEEEAVLRAQEAEKVFGSPAHRDPDAAAARARREFNRARNPSGFARQLAAILSSGSRTEALRSVDVPFTVIHGAADTLVTPSGGARTAEAVPGAVHLEIEGMGHNLPRPLWPEIIDAIVATTERAAPAT